MNKEFADRWVADLRDPKNQQCREVLHDGVGYCCLGRAVVVGGFRLVPRKQGFTDGGEEAFVIDGTQDEDGFNGERETLDDGTMTVLGFSDAQGQPREEPLVEIGGRTYDNLAEANDSRVSFAEIADWVEKNWERL